MIQDNREKVDFNTRLHVVKPENSAVSTKRMLLVAMMAVLLHGGLLAQENFLTAHKSLNSTVPIQGYYDAIDVYNEKLYALAGDTVYTIDMGNAVVLDKMSVTDSTYSGFVDFITVDQERGDIWVGYSTSGNTDDRIYKYDPGQEKWIHIATFPSNFDLAIRNGKALVTGLNSSNFGDPNGIWLLDESGADNHRMLVKIGGYSAGLDIDKDGNIYYATSLLSNNALLTWSAADIDAALESQTDTLGIESAEVLASLPAGAYDLDLDAANNIVFNSNNFVENFIGIWDGASSYDTLATSDQYITRLATYGDLSAKGPGNKVFALAFGYYISEVHYRFANSVATKIKHQAMKVYPNPVQDAFSIETSNMGQGYLVLSDMNGRSIIRQEYMGANEAVDVSFLEPGNYVLNFNNSGRVYKAVIQKY